MTKWQPIETAPKDGSSILGHNIQADRYIVVHWGGEIRGWQAVAISGVPIDSWLPLQKVEDATT